MFQMIAKHKFSLKYTVAVLVIFSAIQWVSSDDDDGEDATVEVEQSDSVDIPYTSPIPSGKVCLSIY